MLHVVVCNVQEYLKLRLAHVNSLKSAGDSPYPHKFIVTISLTEFIEKYESVNDGTQHADVVSVAGLTYSYSSCYSFYRAAAMQARSSYEHLSVRLSVCHTRAL